MIRSLVPPILNSSLTYSPISPLTPSIGTPNTNPIIFSPPNSQPKLQNVPPANPSRSEEHNRTIERIGAEETGTRDLEPDAGEYREEVGGTAAAGAGRFVDGAEGSDEG
jgi:hypothetical protein